MKSEYISKFTKWLKFFIRILFKNCGCSHIGNFQYRLLALFQKKSVHQLLIELKSHFSSIQRREVNLRHSIRTNISSVLPLLHTVNFTLGGRGSVKIKQVILRKNCIMHAHMNIPRTEFSNDFF